MGLNPGGELQVLVSTPIEIRVAGALQLSDGDAERHDVLVLFTTEWCVPWPPLIRLPAPQLIGSSVEGMRVLAAVWSGGVYAQRGGGECTAGGVHGRCGFCHRAEAVAAQLAVEQQERRSDARLRLLDCAVNTCHVPALLGGVAVRARPHASCLSTRGSSSKMSLNPGGFCSA